MAMSCSGSEWNRATMELFVVFKRTCPSAVIRHSACLTSGRVLRWTSALRGMRTSGIVRWANPSFWYVSFLERLRLRSALRDIMKHDSPAAITSEMTRAGARRSLKSRMSFLHINVLWLTTAVPSRAGDRSWFQCFVCDLPTCEQCGRPEVRCWCCG